MIKNTIKGFILILALLMAGSWGALIGHGIEAQDAYEDGRAKGAAAAKSACWHVNKSMREIGICEWASLVSAEVCTGGTR